MAEPGVHPVDTGAPNPLSSQELSEGAIARVKFDRKRFGGGCCAGRPASVAGIGKLLASGKRDMANPAYLSGVQQADKLTAVDDFDRISANAVTAVRTPINPPSRSQPVQLCAFFRFSEDSLRLDVAGAGRARVYKQLPLVEESDLSTSGSNLAETRGPAFS